MSGATKNVKKVVLAYSGGLDTSIILKWLQTTYGCEVVTFTADLGQGEELEPARKKAEMLGIKEIYIEDLRETFVRDYVFPMFRANALYEGVYLLGTSIARPLIARRQIEIAKATGADAVCHGATGKGNDQVRFELSYYSLNPEIKVIAPWREWDLTSRTKLLEFAEKNQIPIARDKRGEAPFSVDANLLHTSSEGKALEDPSQEAPEFVYQRTVSPEEAPDKATYIEVGFEKGDAVSIDGERLSPASLLTKLNELGGKNGIGRLDLVENRFVGMKSRGIYETPGGTILLAAHRGIEFDHARPRRDASQGRSDAALCGADLLRLLVVAGARDAPGPDRQEPGNGHRHRPPQALQGQCGGRRPHFPLFALLDGPCDLRGGRRRLRPERRRRIYQTERAPASSSRRAQQADQRLMRIEAIPIGKNPPHDVNVIVEVPHGGHPVKYEMDKESGTLFVDRFIHTAMQYPANYGFIPHTLSDDGDPVDVLVVSRIPVVPGAVVRVRPIGVLMMTDEAGQDEKILAVPVEKLNPYYKNVRSYTDLPEILIRRIAHFFEHYKDLEEGKWVKIQGWQGPEEAEKIILSAIEAAKQAKNA